MPPFGSDDASTASLMVFGAALMDAPGFVASSPVLPDGERGAPGAQLAATIIAAKSSNSGSLCGLANTISFR